MVINKIDKPAANPDECEEKVFELFMDLGATNEQLDFPVIYAIGREGVAKRKLTDESKDLTPLLDLILEFVPVAKGSVDAPLRAQPFNLAYDNYLGRLAIARVVDGVLKVGDNIFALKEGEEPYKGKETKLFTFKGIKREEVSESLLLVLVAGIPEIYIGETIVHDATLEPFQNYKLMSQRLSSTFGE